MRKCGWSDQNDLKTGSVHFPVHFLKVRVQFPPISGRLRQLRVLARRKAPFRTSCTCQPGSDGAVRVVHIRPSASPPEAWWKLGES